MAYRVFVRNWWKRNLSWPNGLEPDGGARKHTLARGLSETEAREMAQEYNRTHEAGELSRKAEFEETV